MSLVVPVRSFWSGSKIVCRIAESTRGLHPVSDIKLVTDPLCQ